ncbi:MAG: heme-binding domain-containing protein [Crocinitomicaceae bacterium]|nr:heme-binding domain-containing protein [Crocinitomicaceae bacterium]
MKKILKWTFYLLLIGFVVIQFIRIDKSVPEYDKTGDFISVHKPDQKVADMLHNACYDCHSYESVYPWYAEIAPVSWWIGEHIEEGREHLNFSTWSAYDAGKQDDKLEESIEEIQENKMPDPNYIKMHSNADLSDSDKQILVSFLQSLRTNSGSIEGEEHEEEDED